jgi:hypothetical protein
MPMPKTAPSLCVGVALASIALLTLACAPKWKTGMLVDSREVARALGDTADVDPAPFDPKGVPQFEPPKKVRPCCAFGEDLKAEVGPVPVPIYEMANLRGLDEIGPHGYDKGDLTRENNGLVYTCRGGFIDVAHVRDNADRLLFLAMRIARELPNGVEIEMPWEGARRLVTIAPLPKGLLSRHGRWRVATTLAAWATNQMSNWHEIVTWYGWESTLGISEKLSAFSPEDIYSNVLGINIAVGIVLNREMRSREEYDQSMQAWMREALRRLGTVPKAQARQAMHAVDGLWWDSSKRVPDRMLVTRRFLDIGVPVQPWIVAESLPKPDPALEAMCADQPPPLPLTIADKIGEHSIDKLVSVRFEFTKKWIPENFPVPAGEGKVVTPADFPVIIEAVREEGRRDLGADFDKPKGSRAAAPAPAPAASEAPSGE